MRTYLLFVNRIAAILFIFCTGCWMPREPRLYRVVDADTFQPISGAKVWIQPWAPIHPFWPPGDIETTDANGEVNLLAPDGFWFFFSDVDANGYNFVETPKWPLPQALHWVPGIFSI